MSVAFELSKSIFSISPEAEPRPVISLTSILITCIKYCTIFKPKNAKSFFFTTYKHVVYACLITIIL